MQTVKEEGGQQGRELASELKDRVQHDAANEDEVRERAVS